MQRGSRKAEFRVQWTRQLGPDEQQIGIESLEPQSNFWGIDLSDDFEAKKDMQTLMTALSHESKPVMSAHAAVSMRISQDLLAITGILRSDSAIRNQSAR